MRILIFGNSGSGKSTLARQLSQKHGLPRLDLDAIVWEPNKIAVQRSPEAIAASLETFLTKHDHWIIEGCYGELVEAASSQCTELIFLNPGLETCLEHNCKRPWEPHKYASKEAQDACSRTCRHGWRATTNARISGRITPTAGSSIPSQAAKASALE